MQIQQTIKKKIYRLASISEWKAYSSAVFNFERNDIKKFVIFGQGRSGSTLLTDMLNRHPEIQCDSELLNVRWRGKKFFPLLYVKSIAKASNKPNYGFHVKCYQLKDLYKRPDQNVHPRKFLFNLHRSGWKILYLKRSNIFRQAISNFVAESKGKWHLNKGEKLELPKLNIDKNKLVRRMERRENYLSYEKEILEGLPHLEIIYEKDLKDSPEKGLSKILRYLEIQPVPIQSKLRRTSKENLKEYIVNHDEIIDYISKSRFSQYL